MDLSPAPLFTDVAQGPEGGAAYWTNTSDGKRIRVGYWPVDGARGTVLLFPGRTEYIEKYGITANEFAARRLATITLDWRGQGLAERLLDDRQVGHVDAFPDYQKDVAALMRATRELGLPRPYFLLAHSMGGCIGLRAVMEGLSVQAAAFTGPMWDIFVAPPLRSVARVLAKMMPRLGRGHLLPPGRSLGCYVLEEPFRENMLTRDPDMYQMMQDQLIAHPELGLGGPSYIWLREAFMETQHLSSRSAPNVPAICWLGTNERIVGVGQVQSRMESWKMGELIMIEGGEHEVLMEHPNVRGPILDRMETLFLGSSSS
ncbi:MAG: alpha/beta hydrolase [Pseudomonadota bacterium]